MSRRQYKTGYDRHQVMLLPPSLDEYVSENNVVRAIDAYIETLNMTALGFSNTRGGKTAGQPAYAPAMLLKLYMWGYLNRVRSSRRLERETYRNLEVLWLLQGLHPCYKTIADFRKENASALKAVYKDFLVVCKELNLLGGEFVGIDSMFLEGDASKASILTRSQLTKRLARLEQEITAYLATLDQHDAQEAPESSEIQDLTEKLAQLRLRQHACQAILAELKASGETQVSQTDPDARLLNKRTDKGPTAGYNVQCAVDSQHKLLVAGDVVNDGNDLHQLVPMATQAKTNLRGDSLKVAADASYYTHQGVKDCEDAGMTPYVPIPDKQRSTRAQGRFGRDEFSYEAATDTYTCPAEKALVYTTTQTKNGKQMRRYTSQADQCATCPLKGQCLPETTPYRQLYRWEHEEVLERHQQRMEEEGSEVMRKRAGLAEHPFGTLKLWCGWTHFLVRGLPKVRGECHLLLTCYNFKRVLNIIGLDAFRAYCQQRLTRVFQTVQVVARQGTNSAVQDSQNGRMSVCVFIFRHVVGYEVFVKALSFIENDIVTF